MAHLSFFFTVTNEGAELAAVHVVMDGQQVLAVELKCLKIGTFHHELPTHKLISGSILECCVFILQLRREFKYVYYKTNLDRLAWSSAFKNEYKMSQAQIQTHSGAVRRQRR